MPEPLTPNSAAGRAARAGPETPSLPWLRPRRPRLLLVGLPVFAVFAAFGAIIWLAYEHGSEGSPVGEPPLVRAPAVALKLAPEDDGALAGEDGEESEVLDLLSDAPPSDQLERLLPPPEEPLAPTVAEPDVATSEELLAPTIAAPEVATSEEPLASAVGEQEPATPGQSGAAPGATDELPPSDPSAAGAAPPELAATRPEPPPVEQQAAAASAPEPPASKPLPTPEEAEATLDALLAEVTQEPDPAGTPPQPERTETARVEPTAPQPIPSQEARPAVAAPDPAPVARPAPPAEVPSFTPPEGEVTPIERDQRPAITALPPATSAPSAVRPPDGPRVAALGGAFRIQLAAVRGEADARRAWDLFEVDLGPVLAGLESYIERADTANGVFYRVQVGPFATQADAESLCDELKQRNASCFVIRR